MFSAILFVWFYRQTKFVLKAYKTRRLKREAEEKYAYIEEENTGGFIDSSKFEFWSKDGKLTPGTEKDRIHTNRNAQSLPMMKMTSPSKILPVPMKPFSLANGEHTNRYRTVAGTSPKRDPNVYTKALTSPNSAIDSVNVNHIQRQNQINAMYHPNRSKRESSPSRLLSHSLVATKEMQGSQGVSSSSVGKFTSQAKRREEILQSSVAGRRAQPLSPYVKKMSSTMSPVVPDLGNKTFSF